MKKYPTSWNFKLASEQVYSNHQVSCTTHKRTLDLTISSRRKILKEKYQRCSELGGPPQIPTAPPTGSIISCESGTSRETSSHIGQGMVWHRPPYLGPYLTAVSFSVSEWQPANSSPCCSCQGLEQINLYILSGAPKPLLSLGREMNTKVCIYNVYILNPAYTTEGKMSLMDLGESWHWKLRWLMAFWRWKTDPRTRYSHFWDLTMVRVGNGSVAGV